MSSEGSNGDRKNKEGANSEKDVHSANSWETADLGDKKRNEKFLRLMGASKREHHGKIVIGDQKSAHKRPRNEEKHLAEELEEQYEHSMEHRLVGGRRGHLGLGFHPETPEQKEQPEFVEDVGVEAKAEEETEEDVIPGQEDTENDEGTKDEDSISGLDEREKTKIEGQRKRESVDKSPESDVKKMKFVKSNS